MIEEASLRTAGNGENEGAMSGKIRAGPNASNEEAQIRKTDHNDL